MPRIRQFKPEHRQHRKVGPLTDREYRLWASMILEADDAGRLVCSAAQLRAVTWAYHDVKLAHVEAAIQRLAEVGLIRLYEQDGIRYADFPSWRDHQRKDHWYPSIMPEYKDSLNAHVSVREHSSGNGLGKVGMEQDRTGVSGSPPDVPPLVTGLEHGPAAMRTAARDLLAFLNKKAGRNYQPVDSNLDLITALLRKGTTVDQIRGVIGLRAARWKGDPKMDEYLRPSTLFRASKFSQYVGELPASAFQENPDA